MNSLLGGNQAPISLTQFHMRQAGEVAFSQLFYFTSVFAKAVQSDAHVHTFKERYICASESHITLTFGEIELYVKIDQKLTELKECNNHFKLKLTKTL